MSFSRAAIVLQALLALACDKHEPEYVEHPRSDAEAPEHALAPEHVQSIVDAWSHEVSERIERAFADRRGGPRRGVQWTEVERVEIEALRDRARAVIDSASADDRPWLLVGYVYAFTYYGLGTEWADAVLEIPPDHPVWSSTRASLHWASEESGEPTRFIAYVHAVTDTHDNALLEAQVAYLDLERFDRAGDWANARVAWERLAAIEVTQGERTERGVEVIDGSWELDPDRLLRADTSVPEFCSPALIDGKRVDRLCLEDFFPHEGTTLIIGIASWCGGCNEQLPHVLELLRDQPIRTLAFNYDEDPELAATYLRAHGIDDWTTWMPRLEPRDPVVPGDLNLRTIPFMALVDPRGRVQLGPPWLDAPTLAEHLNHAHERR